MKERRKVREVTEGASAQERHQRRQQSTVPLCVAKVVERSAEGTKVKMVAEGERGSDRSKVEEGEDVAHFITH